LFEGFSGFFEAKFNRLIVSWLSKTRLISWGASLPCPSAR
jgi:hypothetical protein